MNMIEWNKYVDHIFCMTYLPSNRINKISKTFENINIDINNNKFFSFAYDIEHCIFTDYYDQMKNNSFNFFNDNTYFGKSQLNDNIHNYIFYIGLNTYRILKIAQYFNYDRIIIFEDDIHFLNDHNYIIKAMEFIKAQYFDMCICQTTFVEAFHGIKSYLLKSNCEDMGNNMFLRTYMPIGVFGGGFNILTKNAINKIVNYFEQNNLITCLDSLDGLRHLIKLNTIFALKPLCIQEKMFELTEDEIKDENTNLNIDEYCNE